jgi:hypothetical protein
MPCPTRFRLTDVERKEADHVDHPSWPLRTPELEQSRTDIARGTSPK